MSFHSCTKCASDGLKNESYAVINFFFFFKLILIIINKIIEVVSAWSSIEKIYQTRNLRKKVIEVIYFFLIHKFCPFWSSVPI